MGKKVALTLVGLVLGAVAGTFATGRVRAQVQPKGITAVHWDQDCEQVHGVDEARTLARARGESGWELVALDAGVMCFKRPLPVPPKPLDPWPGY
jgi:hypothetical protein